MKYYLIAGEASGDLHGSNLMKGLKAKDPECDMRFWGGEMMEEAGGHMVKHYKDTAVMGLVEVIRKLDKIIGNLEECKKDILKYNPDVIILIDYPGFNMKIAKFAKKKGFKVFYYISPKVWAWKESRVKQIRKYVDKLFIIFPFEVDYFKKKGIDAIYLGNPLLDKIDNHPAMSEKFEDFAARHNLRTDKECIALLAGSRKMEIDFLMPIFLELEKRLEGKYTLLLAAAPSIEDSYYRKWLDGSDIQLIKNDTYACLRQSSFAVISSGTASLEAAIIGTPQVVCYGMNRITYWAGRLLVKVKYISLGNIIIDKLAFRELIQDDANADNIISEMHRLSKGSEGYETIKSDYKVIRQMLGAPGASDRFAAKMIELLNNSGDRK